MPPIPTGPVATPARRVSVVVVSWNGLELLRDCLDSLLAQDAAGWQVEIVVVDNGSTDGTVDTLRERYPAVSVIPLDTNIGFAGAANRGMAASDAPFVVLVNNDAVVDAGFVASVLAPFDRPDAERLAAVTARIVLASRYRPLTTTDHAPPGALVGFDGRRWAPADDADPDAVELINSTGAQVTRSGNGRDRDWLARLDEATSERDVFGFCGGAVALRRAALDDVGLFAAELFLYYEDTDLSWRLRRRGWRIEYAAEAVARHRHAASSGTRSDLFLAYNERNRLVVAVRNAPADVVARALARATAHALRDLVRREPSLRQASRRHGRTAAYLLRNLPALLAQRRQIDALATVSRAALRPYLVGDGPAN